jgi:O-antigen/teichoic acid export membrane protein
LALRLRLRAVRAARASRLGLTPITLASVAAAVLAPVLLPALFGSDLSDAVPMVWILLAAGVPYAGVQVLSVVLMAWDRPRAPARAELIAVALTIPGVFVLIPYLGGVGAAIVSLVAYSVNLGVQFVATRRALGGSYLDYLVVSRDDVRWAANRLRRVASHSPV